MERSTQHSRVFAQRIAGRAEYLARIVYYLFMYYTYVLKSLKDNQLYIGSTQDLKRRFSEHQSGKVKSTINRTPFELLFYEAYQARSVALRREKYLKSSDGHKDINKRFNHGEVA